MNITVKNNETYEVMTYNDVTQIEEVDEYTVELYSADGSLIAIVDQERDLLTI